MQLAAMLVLLTVRNMLFPTPHGYTTFLDVCFWPGSQYQIFPPNVTLMKWIYSKNSRVCTTPSQSQVSGAQVGMSCFPSGFFILPLSRFILTLFYIPNFSNNFSSCTYLFTHSILAFTFFLHKFYFPFS